MPKKDTKDINKANKEKNSKNTNKQKNTALKELNEQKNKLKKEIASKPKKEPKKPRKPRKQTKEQNVIDILDVFKAKNIIVDNIEVKTRKKSKKTKTKNDEQKAKIKLYKNADQLLDKNINQVYYDLPNSYNDTIIRTIAQTPHTLFIYWDVNDSLIQNFKNQFGEDFLEKTKPVLEIFNETLNYSFEVEINDFTNSWYLHINNPNSKYRIELRRKPKELYIKDNVNDNSYGTNGGEYLTTDYIFISSSNFIVMPNDHILFENFNPNITFRNVKTGENFVKSFGNMKFNNVLKLYNIYELYNALYKNEIDISKTNLSSSSMPSSNFF